MSSAGHELKKRRTAKALKEQNKEERRAEERQVPSGPSRCELDQGVQAEAYQCHASGTEAGNQSSQAVQTVPGDGEVFETPASLDKMTPL